MINEQLNERKNNLIHVLSLSNNLLNFQLEVF